MNSDKAVLWKVFVGVGHVALFPFEVLVWWKIKCVNVQYDICYVIVACLLDVVVKGRVSTIRWEWED